MPKRRITYADPVLPTEWPWKDGDDPIWPCHECLPWWAARDAAARWMNVDIHFDEDTRQVWVRQWHAIGCPVLAQIDAEPDPEHDEN